MPNRFKALLAGLVSLALMLCAAGSAAADTYTVTRNDDPIPGPCEPGDCSLREALMAANATTAVDDVVVVPASASPYLVQYEMAYLSITDEVEVRGAGADKTIVEGDGKESIFGTFSDKSTLSGLTITGGQAAIQNSGVLVVRDVSIEGNEWNGGTAGILSNGPVTVESSFLGFNRTNSATSGVIFANGPVTVINSTVAQNTSEKGLGAISGNSSVTLVNSAIVSNRSEAASMAAVGGVPLTVRNNVFADNRDSGGLLNCTSTGGLTSLGGNVSDDSSCGGAGSDKPNVNPLLGPLGLHGGTTPVYGLLAGSPAIDATAECPALDQRGVTRPQGSACDSGPYEYEPQQVSILMPTDTQVFIRLGKGKLILDKRGFVRVKLTCLATEVSPPCSGAVRLLPPRPKKKGAAMALAPLAAKSFRIGAGKTKKLSLRLRRPSAEQIRSNPKKRVVFISMWAKDAAGNRAQILKPRKLFPR